MDPQRLTFLFGEHAAAIEPDDLDDPDLRSALLAQAFSEPIDDRDLLGIEVVAEQILGDTPPEVWTTVQRLVAHGIDRDRILHELVVAFAPSLHAALQGGDGDSTAARYRAALDRLPLPDATEVAYVLVELADRPGGIPVDDLVAEALAAIGTAPDDEIAEDLADFVLEDLVGPGGPLAWLPDDRIVTVSAAGLHRRDEEVAHDPSLWRLRGVRGRHQRVSEIFDPGDETVPKVLQALAISDLLAGVAPEPAPEVVASAEAVEAPARALLRLLRHDDVLSTFAVELFDSPEADEDGGARADAVVDAVVAEAERPADVAVARMLAALRAERQPDPIAAEEHLCRAHEADQDLAIALDRLAWYASDRGDAPRAAQLWRQLAPTPGLLADLAVVERYEAPRSSSPGRNDPCWCGSGRKFKQCHLGVVDVAPLPDRVHWLWRKAVAYLERADHRAQDDLIALAFASTGDPGDRTSLLEALDDPLVMDLALIEGGWFTRFLDARGPLLPDDELALARSWLPVARTVYEVEAVRPGGGLDLRDLRRGDLVTVRRPTDGPARQDHDLLCARAVPDGVAHQLVGAVVAVPAGAEHDLLDRLDDGDPERIGEAVAMLRPLTGAP